MGVSHYDTLMANQLIGPGSGTLPSTSGKYYWVDSNAGSDGNTGKSPSVPLATIDAAINKCTADKGDVVVVMPGHTETVVAASGIDQDVAGVRVVGLGIGDSRPVVTFSTSTGASWDVAADGCSVENIVGLAGIDGLTKAFNVTGDGCYLDVEWQDASSTVEAATAVRLDTANDAVLKLVYKGFTAGNAVTSAVKIDDCDNVFIDIDAYGVNSTAWVEMVDVASTNVHVEGRLYTQGVTDFSQDVVDTVTGSTWDADLFDASAGSKVSGGSASALAGGDVGAISSAVSALQTDVGDASARTNLQSLVAMLGNPDSPGATIYASLARGGGGIAYQGNADGGMTPSQTTIACADLAGFGDDFFNTDYYMVVVQNVNSIGTDPAGTMRDITDYVSATGTFTVSSFGANVEEGDELIVLHKSLAAMVDGFDANGYPAQAAGGVPNMLRQLITKQTPQMTSKSYSDLTGYDTAAAFTVTGDVLVRVWGVVGGTQITCTSGTTTLSVGTSEDADACLPATTIDGSDFDATDVWVDNNPEDDAGPVASTSQVVIGGGADIVLTRSVDDITAGALTLYCEWIPLSSDGNVAAA